MSIWNKIHRWVKREVTVLDAQDAVGGNTIEVDVSQHRHIGVSIAGDNTAVLTVKCQGAFLGSADVDFTASKDVDNEWDYLALRDYQDGAIIPGDTGVALTADDVRLFEVNTNSIRTITFEVTARTTGDVTVKVFPVNNQ